MKVKYGPPIPPGLAAPTHGEVRVRLEKLVLHEDLVPTGTPVHDCDVEALWWGEDGPSSVSGTPSTMENSRGTVCLVFPVKTLQLQMEQYFAHMTVAKSGLRLSVVVPASHSGKRFPSVIGSALLKLDALTPKAPISGWFNVMNPQETKHIGRMKLTIWVQYFAGSVLAPRETGHQFAGPPKIPTAIAEKHVDAASQSHEHPPAAEPLPAVKLTADQKDASDAAAERTQSAASSTLNLPQKNKVDQRLVREIFVRGMELRDRMAEASRTTTLDSLPTKTNDLPFVLPQQSTAQRQQTRRPTPKNTLPHSAPAPQFPVPSGSEHLHENIADGAMSDTDDATVSSTSADETQERLVATKPALPVHFFHGAHHLVLSIDRVGFSRLVNEVRFCVRMSKDVTSPIPMGVITTPVFFVPLGSPVKLEALVSTFSSNSKVIVECFSVQSKYDSVNGTYVFVSEKLLGLAVLGLYDQPNRNVFFHDPVSGEDPAEATISLSISAISNEREREGVARAQQLITQQHQQLLASSIGDMPNDGPQNRRRHHRKRGDARRSSHGTKAYHDQHPHRRIEPRQPSKPHSMPVTVSAAQQQAQHAVVVMHPKSAIPPEVPSKLVFQYEIGVICAKGLPMLALEGLPTNVAPATFVCVEDFIHKDGSKLTCWKCPDDRSRIAKPSVNPEIGFCTTVGFFQPPGSSTSFHASTLEPTDVAKCVFSVWTKLDGPESLSSQSPQVDALSKETNFWNQSRQIGRCEIPLHPMKYLPAHSCEGWYHVTIGNATSEPLRHPVGQLKVRVKLAQISEAS